MEEPMDVDLSEEVCPVSPIKIEDLDGKVEDEVDNIGKRRYSEFGASITTTGSTRSTLCHKLTNISRDQSCCAHKFEEGDEIIKINNLFVISWPHSVLLHTMKKLPVIKEGEITLLIRRRITQGGETLDQYLEIKITVQELEEDGKGGGNILYKFLVQISQLSLFEDKDIMKVAFKGVKACYVEHGAIRKHYLMVLDHDDVAAMKIYDENNDSYKFRRYTFEVIGNPNILELCVFQSLKTGEFLTASHMSDLNFVQDDSGNKVEDIKTSDPRFFCIRQVARADTSSLCLESCHFPGHYLYYDCVNKLQMKTCSVVPWENVQFDCYRNYTFDILPA